MLIIVGYCMLLCSLEAALLGTVTGIVSDVSTAKRMQLVCERISGAHFGI